MSAEVRANEDAFDKPDFKKRRITKSSNAVNEKGQSECFRVVRTSMYVSLAPCHIQNPINGVKVQHLDPMVMTYYKKASGVVLSYFNINLHSKNPSEEPLSSLLAKVTDSSAFTFNWISVDLLIWYPQIGDIMDGFVYMQTATHIGLLVHDTFNASIRFRNIPQDWEFVPSQADEYADAEAEDEKSSKFKSFGYWADAEGNKIEGKLAFTVKTIHTSGRMVSLEGTLLAPESELDAQPIFHEKAASKAEESVAAGKHITFDDDEATPEPAAESHDTDTIPGYEAASDDNANSSSSEEDEESE